ncbi:sigma-70 family RNA polymerase sigma factor [Leucobacter coleopterorum]|uniref:Sigma-70 family RNA polymerase sigma factor n=1 Tax=Leucobacter coleopterorum TaxID=2714933 RepID=A0ABX6K2F4_9MICO|nr:sigma-70 family RNA polymerase sigma factor [Leucobacter coleopterorum]
MRVCIRNESINASKRQSKELPSDDLQVLVEQDQIIDLTSDLTSTRDNEAAVKAYQALTTRAQQVLYFSEVEDKSLADIAKELNISEQNVATAASRARDALRTNYLIETVSDLPGCETVKIQYLALHARGKSPRLRHSRIEQHLKTCDSCQKRLKRMTSMRLPVSAILGLATTGEFVRLSALSPSAGQASNAYSQRETSLIANEQRRSVGLRLGLPVAAGIVVAAMSFQGVNPISGDDSPSSVLHQKNEDDSLNETAAAKNRDAGAAPAGRPAATIDSSSPSATHDPSVEDPSVNPPNSDPPNTDPPDTDPPPELPQGVRSVEWVKKPQTYARGGRESNSNYALSSNQELTRRAIELLSPHPAGSRSSTLQQAAPWWWTRQCVCPMPICLNLRHTDCNSWPILPRMRTSLGPQSNQFDPEY